MMEVENAILDELTLSYAACGRVPSMAMDAVARSLAGALRFRDAKQVHEIFARARNVEDIPTQKTLADCMRNYSEEVLKYEAPNPGTREIEYYDPVASWLPDDPDMRRVNVQLAIRNYCIATGDSAYWQYVQTHQTDTREEGGRKVTTWRSPEKVRAFEEPVRKYLGYLYGKYLRMTNTYRTFPQGHEITLEMIPPSVRELRIMLQEEAKASHT